MTPRTFTQPYQLRITSPHPLPQACGSCHRELREFRCPNQDCLMEGQPQEARPETLRPQDMKRSFESPATAITWARTVVRTRRARCPESVVTVTDKRTGHELFRWDGGDAEPVEAPISEWYEGDHA
jgi:hypothetical protein